MVIIMLCERYTPDLRHEISKVDDDRNKDDISPPYRECQINGLLLV